MPSATPRCWCYYGYRCRLYNISLITLQQSPLHAGLKGRFCVSAFSAYFAVEGVSAPSKAHARRVTQVLRIVWALSSLSRVTGVHRHQKDQKCHCGVLHLTSISPGTLAIARSPPHPLRNTFLHPASIGIFIGSHPLHHDPHPGRPLRQAICPTSSYTTPPIFKRGCDGYVNSSSHGVASPLT